jgi:hypothetical protein
VIYSLRHDVDIDEGDRNNFNKSCARDSGHLIQSIQLDSKRSATVRAGSEYMYLAGCGAQPSRLSHLRRSAPMVLADHSGLPLKSSYVAYS